VPQVTFLPFHVEHLASLTPHEAQAGEYARLQEGQGLILAQRSMALSAWVESRCVGAGGVFHVWSGRAEAWGIFSDRTGLFILPVARKIRDIITTYPMRRVEMSVKTDNAEGNKLARLVGFGPPEAILKAYHPDGSDMFMYARIDTK
jgi:hypothetical protein